MTRERQDCRRASKFFTRPTISCTIFTGLELVDIVPGPPKLTLGFRGILDRRIIKGSFATLVRSGVEDREGPACCWRCCISCSKSEHFFSDVSSLRSSSCIVSACFVDLCRKTESSWLASIYQQSVSNISENRLFQSYR